MIAAKNTSVFLQLFVRRVQPELIVMAAWIESKHPGVALTCGFEQRSYPSVHSTDPLRGLDISSLHYQDPPGVCKRINRAWIYDPSRPEKKCALYHDSGRGKHIHLQTHPGTVFTGKDA